MIAALAAMAGKMPGSPTVAGRTLRATKAAH
jgi:hypothetical protein